MTGADSFQKGEKQQKRTEGSMVASSNKLKFRDTLPVQGKREMKRKRGRNGAVI